MRIHCLGIGSIGSLLATRLHNLAHTDVRLILRRKNAAETLTQASMSRSGRTNELPRATISIEEHGVTTKTSDLQVELTLSPYDRQQIEQDSSRAAAGLLPFRSNKPPPKLDLAKFERDDDIDTLVVSTKAPSTLPAIQRLVPRLSSRSTIVIVQNGMGVLEQLIDQFWPEDRSDQLSIYQQSAQAPRGRPSFVCATTTHSAWRKSTTHVVHSGFGDVKFGVLPNKAVSRYLSSIERPPWNVTKANPVIDTTSTVVPSIEHLESLPENVSSLYGTVSRLLASTLNCQWLSYPAFQIAQLEKLAVNASANALTAILGVHNGAILGSPLADSLIESIASECSSVFGAHLHATQPAAAPSPTLSPSHPLSTESLIARTRSVVLQSSRNISSTLSDILAARPYNQGGTMRATDPSITEIEYIHGYVASLARRYGLSAPVCETLGRLVLLKESLVRAGAVDRLVESRLESAIEANYASKAVRRSRTPDVDVGGGSGEAKSGTASTLTVPVSMMGSAKKATLTSSSPSSGESEKAHLRPTQKRKVQVVPGGEGEGAEQGGEKAKNRPGKLKYERAAAFMDKKRRLTEIDLERANEKRRAAMSS